MRRHVPKFWLAAIVAVATVAPAFAQAGGDRTRMESRREEWQKVDEIFKAMGVRPGAVVADIGAGDGFFTTRLASAVGAEGRVYAVDVSASSLKRLRARVETDGLANVEVVEGATDDPKLPAGSLDAALIINAYHEMNQHQAMLTKIRAALKPDGRLVIVEPITSARRSVSREQQTKQHEIGVEYVQQDAREAGFRVARLEDPFTIRRGASGHHDEEWLLVLTLAAPAITAPAAEQPAPAQKPPSVKDEAWKAPELRIGVDEFKKLAAKGEVLVVDVRDAESFRDGRLPGAVLITPEEIFEGNGAEKLRGEKRLIVAYCS